MWARYLPHYHVLRDTITAGTLGAVTLVTATHDQHLWPDGPERLASPDLAGGALLDLGVYPVALADLCLGGLLCRPDHPDVTAVGTLTDRGVDATVSLTLAGQEGGLAVATTTMAAQGGNRAEVVGTLARVEIDGWFYQPTTMRLIARDETVIDTYTPEQVGVRYPRE